MKALEDVEICQKMTLNCISSYKNLTLKKYNIRKSLYDTNNGFKSVLRSKKISQSFIFIAGLTHIVNKYGQREAPHNNYSYSRHKWKTDGRRKFIWQVPCIYIWLIVQFRLENRPELRFKKRFVPSSYPNLFVNVSF